MVEPLEAPEERREEQMVVGVEAKTPANYNVSSRHLYIVTELCRHRHAFKNVLL